LEVKSVTAVSHFDPASGPLLPVAEYIRKSTDHQKYSTENQSEANHDYAAHYEMQIVRTYVDDGISGLTFERRDALQQLIKDVQSGDANFKAILVYDVSRWGRPQDPDEAAYYEFICKRAGIAVHYCAEQFENDGSLVSSIVKNLKRAMAGEYSRELSVKVFAGQKRLIEMGFRVCGVPGYGLRRLLIDEHRIAKGILDRGQWKSITTDRIILIPGPPEEVEIVQRIFYLFVHERMPAARIASFLNKNKMGNGYGRGWTVNLILQILRNEKYIGNNVWNRESYRLQQKRVRNSRDKWIRVEGAFEAIIEKSLFDAAQAIFQERSQGPVSPRPRKYSDAELLDLLRRLLKDRGDLSRRIIRESDFMPWPELYDRRFGCLSNAYKLIGFTPNKNGFGPRIKDRGSRGPRPGGYLEQDLLDALRRILKERGYLTGKVVRETEGAPSLICYRLHFGYLSRAYQLIGYTPDPARVRALRTAQGRKLTNDALLELLQDLLKKRGRLSVNIIDKEKGIPCSETIAARFGSIKKAYELIGYRPERYETRYCRPHGLSDEQLLEGLRKLKRRHGRVTQAVIRNSTDVPSYRVYYVRFGGLSRALQLMERLPEERPKSSLG
jgi:DNA invertase Pin-like site-specific DNA recombinase